MDVEDGQLSLALRDAGLLQHSAAVEDGGLGLALKGIYNFGKTELS